MGFSFLLRTSRCFCLKLTRLCGSSRLCGTLSRRRLESRIPSLSPYKNVLVIIEACFKGNLNFKEVL